MKKTILFSALALLFTGTMFAQETEVKKAEAKKIRKEVKLTEEDGIKTLTIINDENGRVTEEVYTGEAADKKLAELEGSGKTAGDEQMKVKYEEKDGEKVLTIKRMVDGKETEEVYKGEEAEQKLKELESAGGSTKTEQKKIVREEIKMEKSNM